MVSGANPNPMPEPKASRPKARPRIPSGPRPQRSSQSSFRSISTNSVPISSFTERSLANQAFPSSLSGTGEFNDSPLDILIDTEHDYTLSPETSPDLNTASPPPLSISPPRHGSSPQYGHNTSPVKSPVRGKTFALLSGRKEDIATRSQTSPQGSATPSFSPFTISRPASPSSATSPPPKIKPKPSKLNTLNLLNPSTSPTKPVSPGVRHWQQVRAHVLAPTPAEEKPSYKSAKKNNIVSRAAGKFGFRQAAENVLGYEERRRSTFGFAPDLGGMTAEEKEAVARERRKFARDIKACLDACALEETRRRLQRGDDTAEGARSASLSNHRHLPQNVHTSQHTVAQKHHFDPNFSSFAPLLMELHRHLPAARSKRLWSRTCPHHAAILSELGVNFLPNGNSTNVERQQCLEIFGVVVRNWSSDSAEEELDRWLWLCRALMLPDKQLRNRGLPLLISFLHAEPDLPPAHDLPHTVNAFLSLVTALLRLAHALELAGRGLEEHCETVRNLLKEAIAGEMMELDTVSLNEILAVDPNDGAQASGGIEKELMWMAIARCVGHDRQLANWILDENSAILELFAPPPVLHATPPIILQLRALSTSTFFSSVSCVLRGCPPPSMSLQIWQVAETRLIPHVEHLPDPNGDLSTRMATMLLDFELAFYARSTTFESEGVLDPFGISKLSKAGEMPALHRSCVLKLNGEAGWKEAITIAARLLVLDAPIVPLTRLMRYFLSSKPLASLGHECVATFFKRLASVPLPMPDSESFLRFLQASHPQLFYKPLFSLSAATNLANVSAHLRTVRTVSNIISPAQFWTKADPQMVVIVLMGNVGANPSKGKSSEGERSIINVRMGRYACLIELLLAVEEVKKHNRQEKTLRTFLDAIENRMGIALEAEEKLGSLPTWYRSLLCRLFFTLRSITLSTRRSHWQKLVISWFCERSSTPKEDGFASEIRTAYTPLLAAAESSKDTSITGGKAVSVKHNIQGISAIQEDAYFKLPFRESALMLLVLIQSCLVRDEWLILLPHLWARCGAAMQESRPIVFLLMKCGETVPDVWRELVCAELYNPDARQRGLSLLKLSVLYGWRYQLLSQLILNDRRGPVFHFPARSLESVATEIGSSQWIPSHDVQDAALKKFGTTLPVELRQRLMELGWSEEETVAGKSDWEQIPVSTLPSLQLEVDSSMEIGSAPSSPAKSLTRQGSNGSGGSFQSKRRRAVFAPIALSMVSEQAVILAHDPDSLVATSSRDLLRLLQRDDPSNFLRPFTDGLSVDFVAALAELNAVITVCTPAFAYAAMNAITGYLKVALKTDATFGAHAAALATVSTLVSRVSGVSLRAIRKNKAEQVLLPVSIHEEEGGFKLHAPWRHGAVNVQTAQLLILNEILKVNPREVYLFKKMLSNLQIQSSISHLPFARAWLVLVTTLFSTVNRNYNDRAELRHFLSNVAAMVSMHGGTDLLVASHALRVFILCSARFRRLFASMGLSTVSWSLYDLYKAGYSNVAIKDAVEYAARSLYRIHQDSFVYQACVVIAEADFDPKVTYDLLASLSSRNTDLSGVASGLRGLNDKEEIESLVQLLSGPELTFAEIGTEAAERQASKMAEINLDGTPFPKENIIRLLVTVIAANPATKRASNFLRLFTGIFPHVEDPASLELVRESIEALGAVISKGRVGDDPAKLMFNPGEDEVKGDWTPARLEYIRLVESFAISGGLLSLKTTKRTLEMVTDLLRKEPQSVGPAAASILRELARTHFHATGSRPVIFLRDIAPLFLLFIDVVDFSGLLNEITNYIRRTNHDLDAETTRAVIESYVGPAVRLMARASEDDVALNAPMHIATVEVLATAVFLQGDALGILERYPPNTGLLASLVLPLCTSLGTSHEVDNQPLFDSLWIRILHYIINSPKGEQRKNTVSSKAVAAMSVLSLQIVKIVTLRAGESISRTPGLWHYISRHITVLIREGNGKFVENDLLPPRLIDWMMWTTFELVALHSSPLMVELRYLIQSALSALLNDVSLSAPSTPGEGRFPLIPDIGRPRIPSARSPSLFLRGRSASPNPADAESRHISGPRLAPESGFIGAEGGGHSRMPSQHLIPRSANGRAFSTSSFSPGESGSRPSFVDLSARRASRPAFAVPGGSNMNYRFPSSQSVRQLSGGIAAGRKGGGAIVHLLGAPNQVLGATSAAIPSPGIRVAAEESARVLREIRVESMALREAAGRSVRNCKVAFGVVDDDPEEVRILSTHEAMDMVIEQSRLLIEEEFSSLFVRSQEVWDEDEGSSEEKEGYSMEQITPYARHDERKDEEEEVILPDLSAEKRY